MEKLFLHWLVFPLIFTRAVEQYNMTPGRGICSLEFNNLLKCLFREIGHYYFPNTNNYHHIERLEFNRFFASTLDLTCLKDLTHMEIFDTDLPCGYFRLLISQTTRIRLNQQNCPKHHMTTDGDITIAATPHDAMTIDTDGDVITPATNYDSLTSTYSGIPTPANANNAPTDHTSADITLDMKIYIPIAILSGLSSMISVCIIVRKLRHNRNDLGNPSVTSDEQPRTRNPLSYYYEDLIFNDLYSFESDDSDNSFHECN